MGPTHFCLNYDKYIERKYVHLFIDRILTAKRLNSQKGPPTPFSTSNENLKHQISFCLNTLSTYVCKNQPSVLDVAMNCGHCPCEILFYKLEVF